MPRIILRRTKHSPTHTLGVLTVVDEKEIQLYRCFSLELGWHNNAPRTSCVPSGVYTIKLEYSPAFKRKLWELKGVRNRSECKIHGANYVSQLLGCVAPGLAYSDLDKDGVIDITNSRVALQGIHEAMGDATESTITII
jgi:hypothetical protein